MKYYILTTKNMEIVCQAIFSSEKKANEYLKKASKEYACYNNFLGNIIIKQVKERFVKKHLLNLVNNFVAEVEEERSEDKKDLKLQDKNSVKQRLNCVKEVFE